MYAVAGTIPRASGLILYYISLEEVLLRSFPESPAVFVECFIVGISLIVMIYDKVEAIIIGNSFSQSWKLM